MRLPHFVAWAQVAAPGWLLHFLTHKNNPDSKHKIWDSCDSMSSIHIYNKCYRNRHVTCWQIHDIRIAMGHYFHDLQPLKALHQVLQRVKGLYPYMRNTGKTTTTKTICQNLKDIWEKKSNEHQRLKIDKCIMGAAGWFSVGMDVHRLQLWELQQGEATGWDLLMDWWATGRAFANPQCQWKNNQLLLIFVWMTMALGLHNEVLLAALQHFVLLALSPSFSYSNIEEINSVVWDVSFRVSNFLPNEKN